LSLDNPIWITGASGLLGANLAFEFLDRGLPVLPIVGSHGMQCGGFTSIACNLTDSRAVEELFAKHQSPSFIVHCAAATNIDWCELHPEEAMHINARAAENLAVHAHSIGATFVHISTDAIFDGVAGGYNESAPENPLNVYARTKLAGEQVVLHANPGALILRVNLFGWNLQRKFSLAEWILDRLERRESVPGFRDVTFSPILANDLAPWILRLRSLGHSGIYHVGASDYMSKFDFALLVAEIFDLDSSLIVESSLADSTLTALRPRNTWLSAEKLSLTLGFSLPTIRQSLERFRTLRDTGFLQRLKAAASSNSGSGTECLR
jgi:dTDP-4-dehydrorhamnose reductase